MIIKACDICKKNMTGVKSYRLIIKSFVPSCKGFKTERNSDICEECLKKVNEVLEDMKHE